MSFPKFRIARLEARHRRRHPPPGHHTPVVHLARGEDLGDWLQRVRCACGVMGCPERTLGLVVSEPMTPEEWDETHPPQTGALGV